MKNMGRRSSSESVSETDECEVDRTQAGSSDSEIYSPLTSAIQLVNSAMDWSFFKKYLSFLCDGLFHPRQQWVSVELLLA